MLEGTADKGAASTGASSSGNVTSGTASAAMIAAATAASSADAAPAGDKAGTASPTTGTADAGATAGATAQPTGDAAAVAAAAKNGPIPFDRHEAAIKNAREAAIAEFAWAKGMDPADVKVALSLLKGVRTDPKAFWQELGSRINVEKDEPETLPEADLVSEDGKLRTFSESTHKKVLEVFERNLLKRLGGELRPLMEFMHGEQSNRTASETLANNRAQAGRVLAHARENFPHFKENELAIKEKMGTPDFAQIRQQFGAVAALNMAYAAVLKEKVFPGFETAAEDKVRKEYAKKANAGSGSAHPVDQGGEGKVPELRNVDQLARHMERLASQATT